MIWLAAALLLAPRPAAAFDWTQSMCEEVKKPFFSVERVSPGGVKSYKAARSGAAPIEFLLPKPRGEKRVFVLGESVAGLLYGHENDALESLMKLASTGGRPRHLNCGMGGYESSRILLLDQEVLGYDPDLVVVLNGNNESLNKEICPGLLQELQRRFSKYGPYRLFQEKIQKLLPHPSGPGAYTPGDGLKFFEMNLRQMVRLARERRTPIVLCKLPANLSAFAPWGAAPAADPDFARAWSKLEAKKNAEAGRLFALYLKRQPKDPFAHYFLAQALEQESRYEEARRHYRQAMEFDQRPDRCSPSKNAVIARVAKEEGALLADLDAAFERAAPHGIAGGALFGDGVHWFRRYNRLAALQILNAALGAPGKESSAFAAGSWNLKALAGVGDLAEHPKPEPGDAQRDRRLWLLNAAVMLEQWSEDPHGAWGDPSGAGQILERGISLLEQAYLSDPKGFQETTRSKEALRKILRADLFGQDPSADLDRWWPLYLQHAAELYRRVGRPQDSLPLFDEAIRLSPERKMFLAQRDSARRGLGEPLP